MIKSLNKLGIGTILAITGITLTIAGLIILPYAENSLAQVEHANQVKQIVILRDFPDFDLSAEKIVRSSSSNHFVQAGYFIETSSCLDAELFQQGEFFWSIKRVELNFDSACGFVDITVKATSAPETTANVVRDCSSSSSFRQVVVTSVDVTFSGTVGGTSVSGGGTILKTSDTIHSCN